MGTKFKKIIPKKVWTPAQTKEKIEFVMGEIKAFNQELNKIDSQINELNNQKRIIGEKVSNKARYINQLAKQLNELSENEEWKEV